ncbi:MAG: ABC transporter ATP-binding protein, partial [Bacteroidota bacterium]
GVTIAIPLAGYLQIMQVTITETLKQRIFVRSSFDFAYRIPRIKLEAIFKEGYYAPELVNRFFDTLNVQKGLSKILIDFVTSIIQITFALILLAFYHPFFVFFGLSLFLMLFLTLRLTTRKGLESSLKESKYKYMVAHWLEEMARTMGTFKLIGETTLPLEKTNTLVGGYLKHRQRHFRVLIAQYGYVIIFKTIITAGLLILGSVLVVQREINIGQFVASEIVVIIIMNSVEKLILSMETIYDVLTGVEKIAAVTDLPLDMEGKGVHFDKIDTRNGGVDLKIRDLRHNFPNAATASLNGVDLDIKPGEKICISGYSGGGKTTLLHLVGGLFEDFEGSIAYNDVPFRDIDIVSLRAVIGDNLAREELFEGTYEENIIVGRPDIPTQELLDVCESIGLAEYIRSLPNGFSTFIEPEGRKIPASIVSKLILARSIIDAPRLLIMEEEFSTLEHQDKLRISKLLTDPERPWTLLAISHDPEFARLCDRVVIMDKGRIIDQCTYDQLCNKDYYNAIFHVEYLP